MMWANFDIARFIQLFLPIAQRRLLTIGWIKAVLAPLEWLKDDILYRMQHDCRVIYMEKMLNEKFSVAGYDADDHEATKVIYIDEGEIPEYVWLNTSQNPDKIWLGTQYLNTSGFYNDNYSDFVVRCP